MLSPRGERAQCQWKEGRGSAGWSGGALRGMREEQQTVGLYPKSCKEPLEVLFCFVDKD